MHDPQVPAPEPDRKRELVARGTLATIIVALAAFSLGYRWLAFAKLEQTAALFVGLPAFLAVLVALAPTPRSVTGMAVKTATLALLVAVVLLHEGAICVLMAAPLFYGVAVVIGLAVDLARYRGRRGHVLALPVLLSALEGTHPVLSFDRREETTVERIVAGTPDDVARALARTPAYDDETFPVFLRLGFPRPVRVHGEGLAVGDGRAVHFASGDGKPSLLVVEVVESGPGRAVFAVRSDSSPMSRWLTWQGDTVEWEAVGLGHTRVRWTARWTRDLDPAWYFGPVERLGMRLAVGVNVDALATPR